MILWTESIMITKHYRTTDYTTVHHLTLLSNTACFTLYPLCSFFSLHFSFIKKIQRYFRGTVVFGRAATFGFLRYVVDRRRTTTSTFDSHVMRSCTLKLREIWVPAGGKQIIFFVVCSSFELGCITKVVSPTRNNKFPISSTPMFPLGRFSRYSL